MDIGERQRQLRLWAAQDKERQLYDLYGLLYKSEADRLGNQQVLCTTCHRAKTKSDRQVLSRMT